MNMSDDGVVGQLDNFDPVERQKVLENLIRDGIPPGTPQLDVPEINLHSHTFYSFNAYGYSPSRFAWMAKQRGLALAGIVDFDVLDGLEEFLEVCSKIRLKGVVSVESRVFVPEFSDRVINSPGEPGIAYHMGAGFVSRALPDDAETFLQGMLACTATRNRDLLARVNEFMNPLTLDYEADVLPLTPKGNATERHICLAYARKAQAMFPDQEDLLRFWSEKLEASASDLDVPEGGALQGLIRSKTMKKGGVGYVQPGPSSFPTMADMNAFTLSCGAIPMLAWLNGASDGEQAMDELIQIGKASGVAAFNIIPDRNFTAGVDDQMRKNLYEVVELVEAHDLPLMVGTEMNSPGNKFVDDFDSDALRPLVPAFMKGAHIVYAHSVLQKAAGLGYVSQWAENRLPSVQDRMAFFAEFGEVFEPGSEVRLIGADESAAPEDLLKLVK